MSLSLSLCVCVSSGLSRRMVEAVAAPRVMVFLEGGDQVASRAREVLTRSLAYTRYGFTRFCVCMNQSSLYHLRLFA